MFLNKPKRSQTKDQQVSPQSLRKANDAIAQLVAECIASDSPSRFATAGRLCDVGQRLTKAVSLSAADHLDRVDNNYTYPVINADFEQAVNANAELDLRPAARLPPEIAAAISGIQTILGPNQAAERGEREAREVVTLTAARRSRSLTADQRAVINSRLDQLIVNMKERCFPNGKSEVIDLPPLSANASAKPAVVPAVVVRRHQGGKKGTGTDPAPLPEPDRGGALRPARPARRRRGKQVG